MSALQQNRKYPAAKEGERPEGAKALEDIGIHYIKSDEKIRGMSPPGFGVAGLGVPTVTIPLKDYDELLAKAKAYEKLHNNLRDLRDSMLARLTALINVSD